MKESTHRRLFDAVMFWTILTGIFAWLPLVRIMAHPEGYSWQILGMSGTGTEGPYWVFIPLSVWVVVMLFTAFRGPRRLAYPLILLWHLTLTTVVVLGIVQSGAGATWEGQGLHFAVPLWVLIVPFIAFTVLAAVWVVLDHRTGGSPTPGGWSRTNGARLLGSLAALAVAVVLFRMGSQYDWFTAAAILATVGHWILLVQSISMSSESVKPSSR